MDFGAHFNSYLLQKQNAALIHPEMGLDSLVLGLLTVFVDGTLHTNQTHVA